MRLMPRFASAVLLAAPALAAQPAPTVTRADLADAYQRVDARLTIPGIAPELRAEANRIFDQSTLQFFAGRNADAVRTLLRLAARLDGDTAADGPLRRAMALRLTAAPRVHVRGSAAPTLALEPMLPVAGLAPLPVRVRLLDARDREVAAADVLVADSSGAAVPIPFEARRLARLGAGRYRLWVRAVGAARDVPVGTWQVVTRHPDSLRTELATALRSLDTTANRQALAAFRARLANLALDPSPERSAQFLADQEALAASLRREASALRGGRDPYAGRRDDHWRVVVGPGGTAMPVRILPAPSAQRGPRPLVIALHGAGGDENMFPEAYGAGAVARLAAARGAIVASPATVVFQREAGFLDSLVAVVRRSYDVDTTRIVLIGHSMGAAAAWQAAAARPTLIAGSVLLAGAGRAPAAGTSVPRSLWIGAELDPIIPPARIRPAAEAARAAGAPVEYRERAGEGHTLVAGPALVDAFAFLFDGR